MAKLICVLLLAPPIRKRPPRSKDEQRGHSNSPKWVFFSETTSSPPPASAAQQPSSNTGHRDVGGGGRGGRANCQPRVTESALTRTFRCAVLERGESWRASRNEDEQTNRGQGPTREFSLHKTAQLYRCSVSPYVRWTADDILRHIQKTRRVRGIHTIPTLSPERPRVCSKPLGFIHAYTREKHASDTVCTLSFCAMY